MLLSIYTAQPVLRIVALCIITDTIELFHCFISGWGRMRFCYDMAYIVPDKYNIYIYRWIEIRRRRRFLFCYGFGLSVPFWKVFQ